jgi:hypothetical protein
VDDLSGEQRMQLRAAERDFAEHRDSDAAAHLTVLENEIGSVQVDGPFVNRKLARVSGAIQAASRNGSDVSSLQSLSATALQEYMEGRYVETNARLNEILRRLAAMRPRDGG